MEERGGAFVKWSHAMLRNNIHCVGKENLAAGSVARPLMLVRVWGNTQRTRARGFIGQCITRVLA